MIERVIEGPPRTNLRGFVAEQALAFAKEKALPIVVVTYHAFFDDWQQQLPDAVRETPIRFFSDAPAPRQCLYVVEVPDSVAQRIGVYLQKCEDLVWIMKYKAGARHG